MAGDWCMDNDVRATAQVQSENAFENFMMWTKRVTGWAVFFLLVVVVGCNSGVEVGKGKSGSQYNGGQYAPMNLNVKD